MSLQNARYFAEHIEFESKQIRGEATRLAEIGENVAAAHFHLAAGSMDQAASRLREVDAMWQDREVS